MRRHRIAMAQGAAPAAPSRVPCLPAANRAPPVRSRPGAVLRRTPLRHYGKKTPAGFPAGVSEIVQIKSET